MQITPRIIKTLSKGQVTIPASMREDLGIKKDTYLRVYIRDKKIVLEPVDLDKKINLGKYIRTYSDEDIQDFLALDKLDTKTRKKAEKLLRE